MLALSHTLGNDALLELTALRNAGPETGTGSLPAGPCRTAPLDLSIGEPLTAEAPVFGAMAPMGEAAPLAL